MADHGFGGQSALRRAVAVVLAMAGLLLVVAGTRPAAGAIPYGGGTLSNGVVIGAEPLGTWRIDGGSGFGICISSGVHQPTHHYGRPVAFATRDASRYAELIHRYGRSASPVEVAELAALVSHAFDRIDRDRQWALVTAGRGGLSGAHARALLARATELAGPWTTHVLRAADGALQVWVTSAGGRTVPGVTVGLQWTAAAGPSRVDTGASGRVRVAFRPVFGRTGAVTATGLQVGPVGLTVSRSPGQQDMLWHGPLSDARPARTRWLVTRASTVYLSKTDSVSGRPVAGAVVALSDGPGGAAFASVITATKPVTVPSLSGRAGRTVYYRETRAPRGYLADAADGAFTVGTDGGAVSVELRDSPAVPQLSTRAIGAASVPSLGAVAQPGDQVRDRITVSGLPPDNPPIRWTLRLVGPLPLPDSGRCHDIPAGTWRSADALAVTTAAIPATGHGAGPFTVQVDSVPVTLPGSIPRSGCLGWDLRVTPWPGGPPLVSTPDTPAEQVTVVAVQVRTRVQRTVVPVDPGSLAHVGLVDLVDVTGLPADLAGPWDVIADVIAAPVPESGRCADLGPSAFGDADAMATRRFTVRGDGRYQVSITPAGAGEPAGWCVNFAETFVAALWPGGPTPATHHGEKDETVLLAPPKPARPSPPVSSRPVPVRSAPSTRPASPAAPTRLASTGFASGRSTALGCLLLVAGTLLAGGSDRRRWIRRAHRRAARR